MAATHFSGPLVVNDIYSNNNVADVQTSAQTLTAADNGRTIILADAAPGNVTLPAVSISGFNVRVLCGFAITTSAGVISAEGDNIDGMVLVNHAEVRAAAEDQINFIANTALIGDYIDIVSNGTTWIVTGVGDDAGSITATDPA